MAPTGGGNRLSRILPSEWRGRSRGRWLEGVQEKHLHQFSKIWVWSIEVGSHQRGGADGKLIGISRLEHILYLKEGFFESRHDERIDWDFAGAESKSTDRWCWKSFKNLEMMLTAKAKKWGIPCMYAQQKICPKPVCQNGHFREVVKTSLNSRTKFWHRYLLSPLVHLPTPNVLHSAIIKFGLEEM